MSSSWSLLSNLFPSFISFPNTKCSCISCMLTCWHVTLWHCDTVTLWHGDIVTWWHGDVRESYVYVGGGCGSRSSLPYLCFNPADIIIRYHLELYLNNRKYWMFVVMSETISIENTYCLEPWQCGYWWLPSSLPPQTTRTAQWPLSLSSPHFLSAWWRLFRTKSICLHLLQQDWKHWGCCSLRSGEFLWWPDQAPHQANF